ncbi:MAG: 50S ribosomal protein L29 [Candidatus Micrarchaeia archaeon]|jgi:large subunit ribosomal protein L29
MIFRKKELKAMKNEELMENLQKLKVEEAIEKRKRVATGKLSKGSKLRETKRTIARILTILHQRGVA